MMSQIFSFGSYKLEKNGNYTLTDEANDYTITLEPTPANKTLMIKDGFKWMRTNYFVKNAEKPSSPISILDNFLTKKELSNYREKIKNETKLHNNPFGYGFYRSDFNPDLTFIANHDGTYAIRFYSLELSSGTYIQEGNFLKLRDNNVNSSFYVLVDVGGKLRSMLMPGDFLLSKFSKAK